MLKEITKDILRPILTPFRPANIAMFHIGRCGSTVLASLLRQHKRIFWASEYYANIFVEWERAHGGKEVVGKMPEDAIHLLKGDMRKAMHRYYGFEIKPFHFRLIGYSMESFLEQIETLGYTHFIYLDRKNRMRKVISSLIAHADKEKYHQQGKTNTKLNKVIINVDHVEIDYDAKPLIEYLSDFDIQTSAMRALLEPKKLLSLSYEEDIQEDPRIGYRRICDFIGMKPKDVTVKLKRTNPFPVKDMIENLEDVEHVLKGTKYEWMLYD